SPDRVSQRLSVSLATSIPITATWLVMTNSDEEDGDHLSGLTMAQACRYCRYERLLNPMDSLSALVVSAWAGEVSHRLACRSGLVPPPPTGSYPNAIQAGHAREQPPTPQRRPLHGHGPFPRKASELHSPVGAGHAREQNLAPTQSLL